MFAFLDQHNRRATQSISASSRARRQVSASFCVHHAIHWRWSNPFATRYPRSITSIEALADGTVAGQRTATLITAILGTLALLLACIGVYGVVAYAASCREREFGIRIALGSSRSGILKLLFSGIFPLVAIGMVLGSMLTFAMRTWVISLLGANSMHTLPLLVSGLLLCGAAALATFIPARRASHVDPIRALRAE